MEGNNFSDNESIEKDKIPLTLIEDNHNFNSRRNTNRKLKGVNRLYMGEDFAMLFTEDCITCVNETNNFFFLSSLDHKVTSSNYQ